MVVKEKNSLWVCYKNRLYQTGKYLYCTSKNLVPYHQEFFIFGIIMDTSTKNHIGRKIGRIREIKGIKQIDLADRLGMTQQALSLIEQSETVDDEKLGRVAKALGVSKEAIENFSEEKAINYFNTGYDNSVFNNNSHCTFNPLDKLMEVVEENKKLYKELLRAEKDKVKYLEQLLKVQTPVKVVT